MVFTIHAACVSYVSADVEADSFDEAKRKYEDMDGSEFFDSGTGEFRLDMITCEETGETVMY